MRITRENSEREKNRVSVFGSTRVLLWARESNSIEFIWFWFFFRGFYVVTFGLCVCVCVEKKGGGGMSLFQHCMKEYKEWTCRNVMPFWFWPRIVSDVLWLYPIFDIMFASSLKSAQFQTSRHPKWEIISTEHNYPSIRSNVCTVYHLQMQTDSSAQAKEGATKISRFQ